MKEQKNALISMLAFGAIFFFASCNSTDYNNSEVAPPVNDSAVKKEPLMGDTGTGNHINMADSVSNKMIDSTSALPAKDTSTKVLQIKKAKKGKVSIALPAVKPATGAMNMDKEGYYSNVEILPSFPGGQKALETFFEDNIVYPEVASDNGTEGTVTLNFIVDERGKVFNPVIAGKKIGDGIDEEALRVFNKLPVWTAGKIKGNNVKTRYSLPIRFRIN